MKQKLFTLSKHLSSNYIMFGTCSEICVLCCILFTFCFLFLFRHCTSLRPIKIKSRNEWSTHNLTLFLGTGFGCGDIFSIFSAEWKSSVVESSTWMYLDKTKDDWHPGTSDTISYQSPIFCSNRYVSPSFNSDMIPSQSLYLQLLLHLTLENSGFFMSSLMISYTFF